MQRTPKFSLLLVAAIALLALSACGGGAAKSPNPDGDGDPPGEAVFDEMKTALQEIPADYDYQQILTDDTLYVIHNGEAVANHVSMNLFMVESQRGRAASVKIAQFTIEGDPIITYLKYDGGVYYAVVDSTRDAFGEKTYSEYQFPFLKTFYVEEADGSLTTQVYLIQDEDVTYESIQNGENATKSLLLYSITEQPR